jgi:hypothetical protein
MQIQPHHACESDIEISADPTIRLVYRRLPSLNRSDTPADPRSPLELFTYPVGFL